MKRELDLGTDLKSGLNIAVYYDVTRKSGAFFFWPKLQRVTCSSVVRLLLGKHKFLFLTVSLNERNIISERG